MADQLQRQDRDLVLAPHTYAFVQDITRGTVSVYVGPTSKTLTPTDRLQIWTGRKYAQTGDFGQAVKPFVRAGEDQYVVLTNPAEDAPEGFPGEGQIHAAIDLDVGKKVVIPGPIAFGLWPGQDARVIDGHHLNLNQYLVAQVYEPTEAKENIERTVAAPSTGEGSEASAVTADDFTMGQRLIIKGTEVSFYIPPTGIEVIQDDKGAFVREAATLQQLEYATLINENGRRRYERGPQVVFPEPTETFVTEKGERNFRAIELNPQSGLYIKVVAEHANDGDISLKTLRSGSFVDVASGERFREGDELFITGEDMPIYFPKAWQSVIYYGDIRKHHAIAVPAGEGRYVLDREIGKVDLAEGPQMFLPDPRTQVVVRRVLTQKESALMYPGNAEAEQVNAMWRSELEARDAPEIIAGMGAATNYLAATSASASIGEAGSLARSYPTATAFAGDRMRRRTEYTPPRTITLDTKYQGAVRIEPWAGFAVLVYDRQGNRRVVQGPTGFNLEYDETLMPLTLSTGRPKSSTSPLRTAYLQTKNNAVGDVIGVETRDLVPVVMELSLRVNFEGDDPLRWFDVEDYVALLTDHVRSRLRNCAKRHGIEEFYSKTIDIVRDELLGKSIEGERSGLAFGENNMRLYDVEVLTVQIQHPDVANLLTGTTIRAIQGAIQLSEAEEEATRNVRLQEIARARIDESELTAQREADAKVEAVRRLLVENLERVSGRLAEFEEEQKIEELNRADRRADADQQRELTEAMDQVNLTRLRGEVEQFVTRAKAVDPTLVAAIQSFGDQRFTEELLRAIGPAAMASGVATVDLLHQVLKGTPMEGITGTLSQRPLAANGRPKEEVVG